MCVCVCVGGGVYAESLFRDSVFVSLYVNQSKACLVLNVCVEVEYHRFRSKYRKFQDYV